MKCKLDLDQLAVESFEAAPEDRTDLEAYATITCDSRPRIFCASETCP